MILAEHTQSLDSFAQQPAVTLDRVNQTGDAEIITVDGKSRGVLLSPAAYDEMANEAYVASMKMAIAELDAGEGQDLHAAMDDIRAELHAMKAAQQTSPVK